MAPPHAPRAALAARRALARWLTACLMAALLLTFVSLAGLSARANAAPYQPFQVIVNPRNPVGTVSREFLADAFLKKVSRWGDGEPLRPIDLRPDSSVRRAFSDGILRRPVEAVRRYWQQRIFSGRDVPPPEVDSDEAVLRYVAKHRGAVGYVSPAAKLGDAVRVAPVQL